jgi:hypothetical protein
MLISFITIKLPIHSQTQRVGRDRSAPSLPEPIRYVRRSILSEDFADLLSGNSKILQERPNHFLISVSHFVEMNGPRSFPAADVTFRIINSMFRLPDGNDDNGKNKEKKTRIAGTTTTNLTRRKPRSKKAADTTKPCSPISGLSPSRSHHPSDSQIPQKTPPLAVASKSSARNSSLSRQQIAKQSETAQNL